MSNPVIGVVMVLNEIEHMLGCPVDVSLGTETMYFSAQGVRCDVHIDRMALTRPMNEFRELYLIPVVNSMLERMP